MSADGWCSRCFSFKDVAQLVVYPTGFLVVCQLDIQHFDEAGAQVGIKDGRDSFDTPVKVASHSVGRAEKYLGAAVVAKIPDAGMFQKTVYNTGDTYVTAI